MYPSTEESKTIILFTKSNRIFSSNYGRIKPFILAKARAKIMDYIYVHRANIKYVHTDGFISSEKLNIGKTLDVKIGELVYEGYCENVYINSIQDKTQKDNFKV